MAKPFTTSSEQTSGRTGIRGSPRSAGREGQLIGEDSRRLRPIASTSSLDSGYETAVAGEAAGFSNGTPVAHSDNADVDPDDITINFICGTNLCKETFKGSVKLFDCLRPRCPACEEALSPGQDEFLEVDGPSESDALFAYIPVQCSTCEEAFSSPDKLREHTRLCFNAFKSRAMVDFQDDEKSTSELNSNKESDQVSDIISTGCRSSPSSSSTSTIITGSVGGNGSAVQTVPPKMASASERSADSIVYHSDVNVTGTQTTSASSAIHHDSGLTNSTDPDDLNPPHSAISSPFFWLNTPTTEEQETFVAAYLESSRKKLIDRLMVEVHTLLNQQFNARSRTASSEPTKLSPQSKIKDYNGLEDPHSAKRRRHDDSKGEDPEDSEEDGNRSQKRSKNAPKGNERRKLACPYYKRNPARYRNARPCSGPGWDSCHRVKEHLYRRHRLPEHVCLRCNASFQLRTELRSHAMMAERCTLREAATPDEGLDQNQERWLRMKRRLPGAEEDRWKEIYRIVFPADSEELVPSPYYEELEPLVEYERYLARELPVLMRTRLEASILRASEPIESRLLSQIGDMLRDCQADLYRAYTTGVQCPLSETAADSPAIESPLTLDPHVEPAASSPDIPAFFAPPLLPSDVNYPFDALGSDFNESAPANQEPGTFSDSGFHSMITGSDQLVDFLEGYSEESLGQFISLDALLNGSLAGTGPDEGQTTSTDEDMLLQNTEQI